MYDIVYAHEQLKRRIALYGRRPETETTPPDPVRRTRSLRACHLPAAPKPLLRVRDSDAYIPELSERLERDPNLCDGARRCARILAGYTYRRSRETRAAEITVPYLMRALRRCRRTVQRYLRQLERGGYIETAVIASYRSRLCVGLSITLRKPLFARHHERKWPDQLVKSGATSMSLKQRFRYKTTLIPVSSWSQRCMDGVFRAVMKTLPPLAGVPTG